MNRNPRLSRYVINWTPSDGDRQRARAFYQMDQRAVHIRKEGQQAMNRDEASYRLSHAYDRFLDTASSRRVNNRKN